MNQDKNKVITGTISKLELDTLFNEVLKEDYSSTLEKVILKKEGLNNTNFILTEFTELDNFISNLDNKSFMYSYKLKEVTNDLTPQIKDLTELLKDTISKEAELFKIIDEYRKNSSSFDLLIDSNLKDDFIYQKNNRHYTSVFQIEFDIYLSVLLRLLSKFDNVSIIKASNTKSTKEIYNSLYELYSHHEKVSFNKDDFKLTK